MSSAPNKYESGIFGRSATNVNRVVQCRGNGRAVYGWTIWCGKFAIEAEPYVVYQPSSATSADAVASRDDDDDRVVVFNVTPYYNGDLYTGLFVEDTSLATALTIENELKPGMLPHSLLMWHH